MIPIDELLYILLRRCGNTFKIPSQPSYNWSCSFYAQNADRIDCYFICQERPGLGMKVISMCPQMIAVLIKNKGSAIGNNDGPLIQTGPWVW